MTKVFIARPPELQFPVTTQMKYELSPEARVVAPRLPEVATPPKHPDMYSKLYHMTGGSVFDFELNLLDTTSKLPIRAVEVGTGCRKGFTDRLGRIVFNLPRGHNKIVIEGHGYVEKGDFAPEIVKFDPIRLDVDLDSDSIYTVYSTGEVIPGERKVLDNPGHNSGELEDFLKEHWLTIGLVGAAGITFYYLGKSKTQKT